MEIPVRLVIFRACSLSLLFATVPCCAWLPEWSLQSPCDEPIIACDEYKWPEEPPEPVSSFPLILEMLFLLLVAGLLKKYSRRIFTSTDDSEPRPKIWRHCESCHRLISS